MNFESGPDDVGQEFARTDAQMTREPEAPKTSAELQTKYSRSTYLGRVDFGIDLETGEGEAMEIRKTAFDFVSELRERYGNRVIVSGVSVDPDSQELGQYDSYLGVWIDSEVKDAIDQQQL